MPSYFYHLKFELYPNPPPNTKKEAVAGEKEKTQNRAIWLPKSGANIFDTESWPAHKPAKEAEVKARQVWKRSGSLGANTGDLSEKRTARGTIIDCGPSRASSSEYNRDLIPISTNEEVEFPPPSPAHIPCQYETAIKDWRYGAVRIQSLDMMATNESGNSSGGEGSAAQGKMSAGHSQASRKGRGTVAQFESLKEKNTETGWGIVHLYREGDETPGLPEVELYNAKDNGTASTASEVGGRLGGASMSTSGDEGVDYTTLCIPAVPSYFNPNDFLGFVGEKTWEQVSHFRLVMTEQKSRYLVLMKFRDSNVARRWKAEWDGKIYNSMEPETCHVIFIKSITFKTPNTSFPQISHDPFTSSSTTDGLTPFPPPLPHLIELPTCPVCLERMDDTTGLLTTQCQHVFHCACLQKWQSRSCPVCRHSNATLDQDMPPFGSGVEALCSVCDSTEDLWICLICGNVGCGRYKGGHAREHWKSSAHNFALEIVTQHIWDYACTDRGDWVHRLIRNKGDDKVAEFPMANGDNRDEDVVSREKVEALQAEMQQMAISLTQQKDAHYEKLLAQARSETAAAVAAANAATARADEAIKALSELKDKFELLETELTTLQKDYTRERAKSEKAQGLARDFGAKYQEEKSVSSGLLAKINHLTPKLDAKDEDIKKLKEQATDKDDYINDLTVNLATALKMNEMTEEDRQGVSLSVPAPPRGKGKGKGRK